MKLNACYHLVILVVIVIINIECKYSKPSNYSIGFENFNNVSGSRQPAPIGFENVNQGVGANNHTYGKKPGQYKTTTPPVRPLKPNVTKSPILHVTTMRPSRPKVTNRPKPVVTHKPSPTKRPTHHVVTTKPTKPKATHPTTKKPTIPTLPPSIYVRVNVSKVVLPPPNSGVWSFVPPPPIGVSTSSRQPGLLPTTIRPNEALSLPNSDFRMFYDYLQNFTTKTEHTKQDVYQRVKGDKFTYYYEISNYYYKRHLASTFYKVPVNNLKNCATNTTKVMCLPNTNALCLTNGTMMCVTHLSATMSCENGTNYCAVTYLPCDVKYQSCTQSDKFYVGVPCVSKILLLPSTNDFYQKITVSPIEYCVTSVIQPKKLYSAVGSYLSYIVQSVKKQYEALKQNIYKYSTNDLP